MTGRSLQPRCWRRAGGALVLLVALVTVRPSAAAGKGHVALVVNKANPVSELTAAELRKILLGDETRWQGNEKITILLLPQGSDERKTVLTRLLKMTDDDFVRHWISRVFQGEATSGPKTATSAASMAKLVSGVPSAIGIVPADDLQASEGVKVLRLDGKAPGEDGYLLVAQR